MKMKDRKTMTTKAIIGNIEAITAFVDRALKAENCPARPLMQLHIAIDEIVSNISRYAYSSGAGDVTVLIDFDEESRTVILKFTDEGVPFDPTQAADPDLTLPVEKRKAGGLGIFLVRRIMDDVRYHRENGKNVLTIRKKI